MMLCFGLSMLTWYNCTIFSGLLYGNHIEILFWCPTHIVLSFCFVFLRLVGTVLFVPLDCPFLIAPSVFSIVYIIQHNMCLTPLAQTNTNNVNKTCAILQTTGCKFEPNIVVCSRIS
jgi:hypothetical protein